MPDDSRQTTHPGKKAAGVLAALVFAAVSSWFLTAQQETLIYEGGYSDHAADLGGRTMYGVTEGLARRYGYDGTMRELPDTTAAKIAYLEFWAPLMLDSVAALSEPVAREVYDTSYNMGPRWGPRFLQRCLAALNRQGRDYLDPAVDGVMGPRTLQALRGYLQRRDPAVLLRCQNGLQAHRYVYLSEARPANEAFTYGWIKQRVRMP